MRILKYIFLLLLLTLFATTVFIATQKGEFDVERTAIIKSPKSTVFNYVNDFRNWETFGSWKKEDSKMEFYYPIKTVGKGASYSWKGSNGNGNMKTLSVSENQLIHQKMNINGTLSDVFWRFKDSLGGTKVCWRSKGNMGFYFKIYCVLNGGVDKVIGNMFEKSLFNLDKTLDYELHTYSIKINGLVKKLGCFYVKQTITSKISNVPKNLQILITKMVNFFKKNKLVMYGKPFVIYHTFDNAKGITKFSVCIPIKEKIHISEGSDVTTGLLNPFQAVKTSLTGDYSHNKEAWDKTFEYIEKKKLTQNFDGTYVEVYSKSLAQIANPSQWLTEIYIPISIKPKTVYIPKPQIEIPTVPPEQTTETQIP